MKNDKDGRNVSASSLSQRAAGHFSDEVLLIGGRITAGVVRIGKTVRRPSLSSSGFVTRLLNHLEAVGFTGSPGYLGRDQRGREILSYIDGWVPSKFQRFTDNQIRDAAVLLRNFHAATRVSGFTGEHSVICHHDAGPNNTVFQDGRPVAFIDFDMAAPGEPIEDLAYLAWSWCISSKPDRGPASGQAAQMRILLDSYGLDFPDRLAIIDAILERQVRNIRFWRNIEGMTVTSEQIEEYVTWSQREIEFTQANREVFAEVLYAETAPRHDPLI